MHVWFRDGVEVYANSKMDRGRQRGVELGFAYVDILQRWALVYPCMV